MLKRGLTGAMDHNNTVPVNEDFMHLREERKYFYSHVLTTSVTFLYDSGAWK